jgi:hypothetical protein
MALMAAGQGGEHLPMQQSGFDYSQLDEQTAKFAWQRAQEIRWLTDSMAQQVVDVGKKLIEVKAALPTGCWLQWLEEEFMWSQVYANNLMRIAKAFGGMDLSNAKTSITALSLATITSLPPIVLDQARAKIAEGELSAGDVREMVRKVDPHLADTFSTSYWKKRRDMEARQVISHAAEFQAAVRNLQVCLSEVYEPVHPRVKRAVDQLTNLVAVIMDTESDKEQAIFKTRKSQFCTSKYFGVQQKKESGKWASVLRHPEKGRRPIHIGYFDTEEAAARAYDAKAREVYGDKARLNFPDA